MDYKMYHPKNVSPFYDAWIIGYILCERCYTATPKYVTNGWILYYKKRDMSDIEIKKRYYKMFKDICTNNLLYHYYFHSMCRGLCTFVDEMPLPSNVKVCRA